MATASRKKSGFNFVAEGEQMLFALGARPGGSYGLLLETIAGPLECKVYDDWIAMRFLDVKAAKERIAGGSLNSYSGKWNWHFDKPSAADLQALSQRLSKIVASTDSRQGDAPDAGPFRFALAKSVEDGLAGAFIEGPYVDFSPSWLAHDSIIFALREDGSAELAIDKMLENAEQMSQEHTEVLFSGLSALEGADKSRLLAVLARSPWYWDPSSDGWAKKPAWLKEALAKENPVVPRPPSEAVQPSQPRSRAERFGT